MRNIVLICTAEMSTSMLIKKMKDAAKKEGYDVKIAVYPVEEAQKAGEGADLVLLGPQIRFEFNRVKELVKCPVEIIDTSAYGTMNGAKVLARAKEILGG